MNKAKLISAAVGALLVVIVILQNTAPVTIKILLLEFAVPNAILIFLTWLIGLATGFILALNFCKRQGEGKQPEEAAK
jgi:uncharacterized integral membrane protein